MLWIFLILFLGVIGAKYYTAVGSRNLERRLNRVKAALDDAWRKLKTEREKQAEFVDQEELAVLRVRFMKELIEDIQIRLSTNADHRSEPKEVKAEISGGVMRF